MVYEGPDVVIRKINDHLWEGNGKLKGEEVSSGMGGLNRVLTYEGVRYNYRD